MSIAHQEQCAGGRNIVDRTDDAGAPLKQDSRDLRSLMSRHELSLSQMTYGAMSLGHSDAGWLIITSQAATIHPHDLSDPVPLVGKGLAAGLPPHVRVRLDLQLGAGRRPLDHLRETARVEGGAPLAEEDER